MSSPNCSRTMSLMESRRPKPVSKRAVQPVMPMMVMKNRFLYRKRLRAVTLWVNFIRRQRGVMRSKRMRLPAGGALGRMSWAAQSRREPRRAPRVAAITASRMSPADRRI